MSFSIYNKTLSLNEAVIFILTNLASKNTHEEVKSELAHAYFQLLFKDDTNYPLHWNVQSCMGILGIFFSFKYLSPTFLSSITTQFFIKKIKRALWGNLEISRSFPYMQVFFFYFFYFLGEGGDWDSLHARLNSHYEAWSYKKKKHKKIEAYRISVYKKPTVKRCLLILGLQTLIS